MAVHQPIIDRPTPDGHSTPAIAVLTSGCVTVCVCVCVCAVITSMHLCLGRG